MSVKLSIIIPCYNCEKTLEEAVESCFTQEIENFEIVMVDDGSKDNTRKIMQTLANKHPEIKLLYNEKNMGGGATRNKAVENSLAEIIFCLDSDDLLPTGTLKKMYNFIIDKKCDGIGLHKSIKFNGRNKDDIFRIDIFGYIGEKIPIDSLIEKQGRPLCPLYSVFMFTKKAWKKCGGYPEDHGFDTQGFAWKFLLNGLIAYTCPDTSYLHRINFHKSYYIREYLSGKVNSNWIKIFTEFIPCFKNEVINEIIDFDINSDKNILDLMRSFQNIFEEHNTYNDLSQKIQFSNNVLSYKEFYYILFKAARNITKYDINSIIKNNSNYKIPSYIDIDDNKVVFKLPNKINLFIKIIRKIKKKLRKNETLYKIYSIFLSFKNNLINLFKQRKDRLNYYKKINNIIKNKEIILKIRYGGLGDWLVFTTLPRLLKEKYNINFYLSEESLGMVRNKDIYKICFETNPFYCGTKNTSDPFEIKIFSIEKSILNFIFDINGHNLINIIESQFKLPLSDKPEIYYIPKKIPEYEKTILIDKNYISGKKLGWNYKDTLFDKETSCYLSKDDKITKVDPTKQDIYRYTDMIYSCKRFISTLSGGAALAACFNKEFSVILPSNIIGGSIDNFTFKKSKAKYIK